MKTSLKYVALLSAWLLPIATQAFAATTWEASSTIVPSSSRQDIATVTVTDVGQNFIVAKFLAAKPLKNYNNVQDSIYVSFDSQLTDKYGNFSNTNVLKISPSRTNELFTSDLINHWDSNDVSAKPQTFTTIFSGATNKLEWAIYKADIAQFEFLAATSKRGMIMGPTDAVSTQIASTPIPAVAWLLATGIVCLVGLKRKSGIA